MIVGESSNFDILLQGESPNFMSKKTHVFNKFQSYDNIVDKGCAGGLNLKIPAL